MTLFAAFLGAPLAHRALHDAANGIPENGVTAVRNAVQAGYGIEIDVQLSADGQAMVFHDATLDRMTATTGPVRDRTARDLTQIRLTGSQENIPTLATVLKIVDGAVPLLIEIKDQSGGIGEAEDHLERAVSAALDGYTGPVAVMSFNPYCVHAMREHARHIPRGLTTCAFMPSQWPGLSSATCASLRSMRSFDKVAASFISHDWNDLGSPRVAELKAQGVPVLCWTVRNTQTEAEARRIADNITFEGYMPPLDPPA
jgi:glycerophosphoryl diester phosphodiesterase